MGFACDPTLILRINATTTWVKDSLVINLWQRWPYTKVVSNIYINIQLLLSIRNTKTRWRKRIKSYVDAFQIRFISNQTFNNIRFTKTARVYLNIYRIFFLALPFLAQLKLYSCQAHIRNSLWQYLGMSWWCWRDGGACCPVWSPAHTDTRTPAVSPAQRETEDGPHPAPASARTPKVDGQFGWQPSESPPPCVKRILTLWLRIKMCHIYP